MLPTLLFLKYLLNLWMNYSNILFLDNHLINKVQKSERETEGHKRIVEKNMWYSYFKNCKRFLDLATSVQQKLQSRKNYKQILSYNRMKKDFVVPLRILIQSGC